MKGMGPLMKEGKDRADPREGVEDNWGVRSLVALEVAAAVPGRPRAEGADERVEAEEAAEERRAGLS
jgi:hypothetical protein